MNTLLLSSEGQTSYQGTDPLLSYLISSHLSSSKSLIDGVWVYWLGESSIGSTPGYDPGTDLDGSAPGVDPFTLHGGFACRQS
jgi:hypothetical protein